jgi:hypothetical protein
MDHIVPIAGQMLRVTTHRLGGSDPVHIPIIVAEPDPKMAETIVRAIVTLDEDVVAVGPLTADYIEAFHLEPGQFTHWREIP